MMRWIDALDHRDATALRSLVLARDVLRDN